jgi:hypothetical protein
LRLMKMHPFLAFHLFTLRPEDDALPSIEHASIFRDDES